MLAAVLAAALSAAAPQHCDLATDGATLRQLKTRRWPALYAQPDVRGLEALLAPEFQMIEGDGTVSKRADEIAYLGRKAPDPPGRSFVYTIERLDVFETCTAIVSGRGRIVMPPATPGGRPTVTTYSSSNVLIKRGGVWLAVASHVSGEKEETAP